MDNYTEEDYIREEKERFNKLFPLINYKIMYEKARKSHDCEMCGNEIPIGDHVWWYKPNPTYNKKTKKNDYYKWRTRCTDCEPSSHEELKQIKSKEAYYG